MRKIIEADYDQIYLLPPSLDEMVPEDHLVRFLREFVAVIDLSALEFKKTSEVGGTVYSPGLLLSVWLYGYFKKIRSCRAMEEACCNEIAMLWLSGNTRPDHNTLWRFWRDNKKAIGNLYKQTVKVAIKSDLVGLTLQAVDGTKIQAVVSGRRGYSLEQNQALLAELDQAVKDQERGIEATISRDSNTPAAKLPKTLRGKKQLVEKIQSALHQMQEEERGYCHPHEPDARRVKLDERNRFGHNAQAVVDAKEKIIVGADVVASENDSGQLLPMIGKAKEQTGVVPTTLVDGGYTSGETIRLAQEQNLDVVMPLPSASANREENPYHTSKFQYDKERDVVICPQKAEIGFSRERTHRGMQVRIYRSSATCRGCPVKSLCTKSRHGRCIEVTVNSQAIEVHRQKMKAPLMRELYRLRSQIVEPVFAHIKEHGGFRRWTVCGQTNVRAQWLLICAVWNLGRLYKQWKSNLKGPKSGPARLEGACAGLLYDLLAPVLCLLGLDDFYPGQMRRINFSI